MMFDTLRICLIQNYLSASQNINFVNIVLSCLPKNKILGSIWLQNSLKRIQEVNGCPWEYRIIEKQSQKLKSLAWNFIIINQNTIEYMSM